MTPTGHLDTEACYRAVLSRDRRFDGVFYTAVRTTGIYCRPSCPARTPRLCPRQLPPDRRERPVGRLPRLQAVPARCHPRQPRVGRRSRRRRSGDAPDRRRPGRPRGGGGSRRTRRLQHAPPDPAAVPRARRRPARAGSRPTGPDRAGAPRVDRPADHRRGVRRRVLQRPTVQRDGARGLRSPRRRSCVAPPHARSARGRSSRRGPPTCASTCAWPCAPRSPVAGCSTSSPTTWCRASRSPAGGWYARTLDLPHGPGTVRLHLADVAHSDGTGFVRAEFFLHDLRDTAAAVERVRRLLDADCDPVAIDEQLGADPLLARPGAGDPGPARARAGRRRRDGRTHGDRAAGERHRRTHRDRAHRGRARARGGLTGAGAHPPVPRRRDAGGGRSGDAADAAGPGPGTGGPRGRTRRRRGGARPRARPRRRTPLRCSRCPASVRGPPTTSRCARSAHPDVFLPTDLAVRRVLADLAGSGDCS